MIQYRQVINNISFLPQFISDYENELANARQECRITGVLESNLKTLPGITEHRFNQLQEIEAVLNFLNIEIRKIKQKHYKKYLETYAKALTSRDAEKYAYADSEVIDYEKIINEIALLRNKYLGIIKALEQKSFQVGAIVRLRTAGLEDAAL